MDVAGTSNLGANVTSSGKQTYTGAVTLSTGVSLDAGGNDVQFIGGIVGGGNSLALTNSSNLDLDAAAAGFPSEMREL